MSEPIDRQLEAMTLREAGLEFRDIAARLKMSTAGARYSAIRGYARAWGISTKEADEQLKARTLQLLDTRDNAIAFDVQEGMSYAEAAREHNVSVATVSCAVRTHKYRAQDREADWG